MKHRAIRQVRTLVLACAAFSPLLLAGCKSAPPPVPAPAPVATVSALAAQADRLTEDRNWPAAAGQWKKAADQYRLLNDLPNLALALHNLGFTQGQLGLFAEARENLNQAASLNDKLSLPGPWWSDQIGLLQVAALAGEEESLAELFSQLEPRSGQIQDATLRGMFLNERALWERKQGKFRPAAASLQEAEAQFKAAASRRGLASVQANRADLLTEEKNYPAARESWSAALRMFEQLADVHGITRALQGWGRTLVVEGQDLATAEDLLSRAAENYRTLGRPTERRLTLELLLQALNAQKKTKEALALEKLLQELAPPVKP